MSSGNAGAEYHSNSSNSSSSPTSLSDIHLARSRVESTLPTRSCGQIFKNHFVNGGNKNETTSTRRSRLNFSGLCSGYSVAESISASSCKSRPQSTPIMSSDTPLEKLLMIIIIQMMKMRVLTTLLKKYLAIFGIDS